jgi:hypothetical protein
VDYTSAPATTDLTIKADSTTGTALLTATNTNTDIPIRALGSPSAVDEGRAATAATDATDGGGFYTKGLQIDVAQADVVANEIIIDLWVDICRLEIVTLRPTGGAGTASATRVVKTNGAGKVRGLFIDFGTTVPATADVTIKADDTNGTTMFTSTNSATDLSASNSGVALGLIGIDEANGAMAATDGSSGGHPFKTGVFVTVAQADDWTTDALKGVIVGLFLKQ